MLVEVKRKEAESILALKLNESIQLQIELIQLVIDSDSQGTEISEKLPNGSIHIYDESIQ